MHENSLANLKPFKPGDVGNPGGKTSAHRKLEIEAAELAAKIQFDLVSALAEVVKDGGVVALENIKGDVLKLIKDAQDRGWGSPKSSVDLSSDDGSMSPNSASDAVLDALKRKHGVSGA